MNQWNRRGFFQRSKQLGAVAAGWTLLGKARSVRATPANEQISMALIGCGGRGNALARGFASRGDCKITYVADVNPAMYEKYASGIAASQGNQVPRFVKDFRHALDDPSLDAIIVATPTHWHALATVWGCQAGKDVFVEKPLAHSAWEGQQMVKAARKYQRVVQVGTQNRSAPYNEAPRQYIADGKLGKVHFVRVLNQKLWENFDMAPNKTPPPGFDWDMWNGPAPEHPYNDTLHKSIAPGAASTRKAPPRRPILRSPPSPTTGIWS